MDCLNRKANIISRIRRPSIIQWWRREEAVSKVSKIRKLLENSMSPNFFFSNNTFKNYLNALAAFLPIGLFLAAVPPNVITINVNR